MLAVVCSCRLRLIDMELASQLLKRTFFLSHSRLYVGKEHVKVFDALLQQFFIDDFDFLFRFRSLVELGTFFLIRV